MLGCVDEFKELVACRLGTSAFAERSGVPASDRYGMLFG